MNDMTETELEEWLEQMSSQDGSGIVNGLAQYEALFFIIIFALVALFFIWRYFTKKKKDNALNDELSAYYDEYMESDLDMTFEDFIFCKAHHINTKKKKQNAIVKSENEQTECTDEELKSETCDETDDGYENGEDYNG